MRPDGSPVTAFFWVAHPAIAMAISAAITLIEDLNAITIWFLSGG